MNKYLILGVLFVSITAHAEGDNPKVKACNDSDVKTMHFTEHSIQVTGLPEIAPGYPAKDDSIKGFKQVAFKAVGTLPYDPEIYTESWNIPPVKEQKKINREIITTSSYEQLSPDFQYFQKGNKLYAAPVIYSSTEPNDRKIAEIGYIDEKNQVKLSKEIERSGMHRYTTLAGSYLDCGDTFRLYNLSALYDKSKLMASQLNSKKDIAVESPQSTRNPLKTLRDTTEEKAGLSPSGTAKMGN